MAIVMVLLLHSADVGRAALLRALFHAVPLLLLLVVVTILSEYFIGSGD